MQYDSPDRGLTSCDSHRVKIVVGFIGEALQTVAEIGWQFLSLHQGKFLQLLPGGLVLLGIVECHRTGQLSLAIW